MSPASPATAEMPNARKADARTGAQTGAPARILTPIVQSGAVDVDDLRGLERSATLRDALVRRAADIVPLLRDNAEETENGRRVVEANIEAIRAAGLFRISVPRRLGGLEVDMRTFLDVSRELAMGCGSTAWVTTLLNVCSVFTGMAGAGAQEDVWGADPDARVAGVFAPSAKSVAVEGGFRVTGKWPWASGCLHADWAFVGIPIVDAAGAEIDQGFALIPMREVTIEDSWFVVGMQGTGSNTIVADDVFIPHRHIMSVPSLIAGDPPTPYKDEALYRSSFIPFAALALAGPQLGLCTRALDYVIEKSATRGISYSFYGSQRDSPSFQLGIAEAANKVDIAHLLAYRGAATIDDAAREGRKLSYVERARVRMDTGQAIIHAREAVDLLISIHGAGAFGTASPLQRIWRDCETAGRHAVISPSIATEVYGRALLGIEGGVTALV